VTHNIAFRSEKLAGGVEKTFVGMTINTAIDANTGEASPKGTFRLENIFSAYAKMSFARQKIFEIGYRANRLSYQAFG